MVDIAASAIGALARNVASVVMVIVIVIVISIILFGVEGGPNPRQRNESGAVLDRLDELVDRGNASETGVTAIDAARQIGDPSTRRERIHTIEKDRR